MEVCVYVVRVWERFFKGIGFELRIEGEKDLVRFIDS